MYDGEDVAKYKEKDWLKIRGEKIWRMVMQDPMTSLNPLKKVGKQIQESIEHHTRVSRAQEPKRLPSRCWPRFSSLPQGQLRPVAPMSSPAVCVSVWSSPLQLPAIRRC